MKNLNTRIKQLEGQYAGRLQMQQWRAEDPITLERLRRYLPVVKETVEAEVSHALTTEECEHGMQEIFRQYQEKQRHGVSKAD